MISKFFMLLRIPVLIGVLDSSNYIMYLANINNTLYYSIIVIAKAAILVAFSSKYIKRMKRMMPESMFLCLTMIGLASSIFLYDVELLAIIQYCMFFFSLFLTLLFVRSDIRGYASGVAVSGFLILAVYIPLVHLGKIDNHYGRFLFLGDMHPNLGGEILATVLILSSFCLRFKSFTFLFLSIFYACMLMQSRSSLLAIMICWVLYCVRLIIQRKGLKTAVLLFGVGVILVPTVVLIGVVSVPTVGDFVTGFFADKIFLVSNEYRGGGTGLSGRDHHWAVSLELFADHPFWGVGIDYPARLNVLQPHNWFLYSITQFGLVGVFLCLFVLAQFIIVLKRSMNYTVVLIPLLLMMLINDRFMNLNIYPFGLYVILFSIGSGRTHQLKRQ
ncbi:O-antigen ligase family protein [Hirschia litorea]|uniref:O-antigen ligase family protein n=1 Tax=Hirschia litorea TaxID=1199156 RepID=A0ABW2IPU2_9PROT